MAAKTLLTATADIGTPLPSGVPLISVKGVSKSYGGVAALSGVDFAVDQGSIHALLGENGAGKSTLIKILSGVVKADSGVAHFEGQEVALGTPRHSADLGIACVFQELSLVPDLSVADNIFITRGTQRLGFFNRFKQRRDAEQILAHLDCEDIDPRIPVRALSLAQAQMVEIAKALVRDPRLLILDEATSALSERHVARLFDIIRGLKQQGKGLIYISHRLHEIDTIADTCSVFRNGRHVGTFPQGSKSPGAVVEMMIGRAITQVYPPKPRDITGEKLLEIDGLRWENKLDGVSFHVRRGEIYGFGGLEGQGQTETLLALFGTLRRVSGEVKVSGTPLKLPNPHRAKSGDVRFAYVPEDRRSEGLHLRQPIARNLTLTVLDKLSRSGLIDNTREAKMITEMIGNLQIKASSPNAPVGTLSGGNQQKVVIAKWLAIEPHVILLSDPTRGIDVGTKAEIYLLLRDLAAKGAAIILYTTDYDELIGLCDRVGVFYHGRIAQELSGAAITEQAILNASFGLETDHGETKH
jgi:ribose transport system ATP-binding protein